jgi:hypothetical protein
LGAVIAVTQGAAAGAQTCGWEWVNPMPPRVDIYRLKLEANTFVGVGAGGLIIRSHDGLSWTTVDSGVDDDLFGVDRGAGVFVAVGDHVILASPTGERWATVVNDPNATFLDVEFSASRFVVVGEGLGDTVLTSNLGGTWEAVPVPWTGPADSITGSDDGFYVAVGVEIWHSPDGFDWNYEGAAPATQGFLARRPPTKRTGIDLFELDRVDLAWTGSRLLWAGGSELWSRAAEGKWTMVSSLGGCPPWSEWLGLTAGSGWAMASGISGCPAPYLDPTVSLTISVDGGASFRSPFQVELGGFPALARYGARWIAAGAYGDLIVSQDGVNWECPGGGCSSLSCADEFADLVRGEDDWLAVGGIGLCDGHLKRRSGGTTGHSSHGDEWEILQQPIDRIRGATHTGVEYIGVGDGWIGTSEDGEVWDVDDAPDNASLLAVAVGAGRIVTTGENGALFRRDSGGEWVRPIIGVDVDLGRIVWDGELFVVLGQQGTILVANDGRNWDEALTTTESDLHGVATAPDQRIIVGSDGVVLASIDGNVWLPRRSGVDSMLHDVVFGDGRFVAVGWDEHPDGSRPAVVLSSIDGVHWTRFSAPGEALTRVEWTGEQWIAVGGERTILRADCIGSIVTVDDEHLQIPLDETVELLVTLSDEVDDDAVVTLRSSSPDKVVVPRSVTVMAGSDTVVVPVTGEAVCAGEVITLSLPDELGGGTTTTLASVQPPEWTPRMPSGRVRP